MSVLVINSGSSSLKFSVINMATEAEIISGNAESLETDSPKLTVNEPSTGRVTVIPLDAGSSHIEALESLKNTLSEKTGLIENIEAVGHRVVHGGEFFSEAVIIDDKIIKQIEHCNHLAPLHNPANLLGVTASQTYFPNARQVAVFDTAFHQTIPEWSYTYPIPYSLYQEHGIRRYGFHGTSHKFIAQETARILGKPITETSLISAHLGNGCSACAINRGQSVDTTMGLTPLEGLVMGTRSGSIDPGIFGFLHRERGMTVADIETLLNKDSGLLGVSEISNDMRTLRTEAESLNRRAKLAIDIFVFRLAKSIAALRVSLRKMDALVFTGGIGENDALTRKETLNMLSYLGLEIDESANLIHGKETGGRITLERSPLSAYVIPTNEELMIAKETQKLLDRSK